MDKFDTLHDDRTLRWSCIELDDNCNSGEFTFDYTKNGFT